MKKKYYLFRMNSKVIGVYPFIILAICAVIFLLIYQGDSGKVFGDNMTLASILLLPYLIIHELFHSISYVIHGAKFKNVVYGAAIENGVLCCLCKQNINKKNILISLLYPFIFIGIVTLVIGIVFNIPVLVLLSLFNITGCSGDLVMFFDLVKLKDFEYSEFDDPTSFGIYTANDLSKKKMHGLDYLGETDKLDIKDYRKVTISKTSWIIFIIVIIASIINIIGLLTE